MTRSNAPAYMTGFGNHFATEAATAARHHRNLTVETHDRASLLGSAGLAPIVG